MPEQARQKTLVNIGTVPANGWVIKVIPFNPGSGDLKLEGTTVDVALAAAIPLPIFAFGRVTGPNQVTVGFRNFSNASQAAGTQNVYILIDMYSDDEWVPF